MMETDEQIYQKDQADYLPVFARYKIVLDHGDGVYVYDTHGKKYLDYLGGIAVNVLGHAYPALVKAVAEQAGKMIHCSNLYYTQTQADAAAKLVKLSGLGKVFFGNSGAEANEGAIKLARKYAHQQDPEKSRIITALHSFHGRTIATLTATGQPHYHEGFGPLPGGFDYVPFNDIAALEKLMSDKDDQQTQMAMLLQQQLGPEFVTAWKHMQLLKQQAGTTQMRLPFFIMPSTQPQ